MQRYEDKISEEAKKIWSKIVDGDGHLDHSYAKMDLLLAMRTFVREAGEDEFHRFIKTYLIEDLNTQKEEEQSCKLKKSKNDLPRCF